MTISCMSRRKRLLVDGIELQFQGDAMPVYVKHECHFELEPNRPRDERIKVTFTPRYLAWTNTYKIRVSFREIIRGGVGKVQRRIHEDLPLPFVVIDPVTDSLGRAFISFKQPEDQVLAKPLLHDEAMAAT